MLPFPRSTPCEDYSSCPPPLTATASTSIRKWWAFRLRPFWSAADITRFASAHADKIARSTCLAVERCRSRIRDEIVNVRGFRCTAARPALRKVSRVTGVRVTSPPLRSLRSIRERFAGFGMRWHTGRGDPIRGFPAHRGGSCEDSAIADPGTELAPLTGMHALDVSGELLASERPTIPVPPPRDSGVRLQVEKKAYYAATVDVVVCDLSRDPRSEEFTSAESCPLPVTERSPILPSAPPLAKGSHPALESGVFPAVRPQLRKTDRRRRLPSAR